MRNIDPSIWRDEWFAAQDILGRLLWMGILSCVADDQGRFLDNAELIKSDVFPMDKMDAEEIEHWITFFCVDSKVKRYVSSGKKLVQVLNWWKYQSSSSWMGKSKYPAPDGWQDFWRYHTVGHKIEVSPNWALRSGLPSALLSKDVKEEDNEEEEDKKPAQTKTPASAAYFVDAGYADSNRVLLAASQLAALPANETSRLDSVYAMIAAYGKDKCLEALTECRIAWCKTPKKSGNGGGTYSVLNFGWVDWASEFLSTGNKHWEVKNKQPPEIVPAPLTDDSKNFVPPPAHLRAKAHAATT